MDGHSRVEPARRGVLAFRTEAGKVADAGVDRVDREQSVRLGGQERPGAHLPSDVAIAAARPPAPGSAQAGHQVLGAPGETRQTGRGGDLGSECAPRADSMVPMTDRSLRPASCAALSVFASITRMPGMPRTTARSASWKAGGVYPHHAAVQVNCGCGDCCPGDVLPVRRDRVLEVEDDQVGPLEGFGETVGAVAGAEQPCRSRVPAHRGRIRTRAVRRASATTMPSWLRAVWDMVTTPSPGRLCERRHSVTSVSA